MKSKYTQYLQSPEWEKKSDEVLRQANYRCECGRRAVQVHHKTYERIFCERLSDLQALCDDCHKFKHGLLDECGERRRQELLDRKFAAYYAPQRRI